MFGDHTVTHWITLSHSPGTELSLQQGLCGDFINQVMVLPPHKNSLDVQAEKSEREYLHCKKSTCFMKGLLAGSL